MGFLPRFLLQEFARKMLKRMNAMQRMNRSQRPHSQLVVEYMSGERKRLLVGGEEGGMREETGRMRHTSFKDGGRHCEWVSSDEVGGW